MNAANKPLEIEWTRQYGHISDIEESKDEDMGQGNDPAEGDISDLVAIHETWEPQAQPRLRRTEAEAIEVRPRRSRGREWEAEAFEAALEEARQGVVHLTEALDILSRFGDPKNQGALYAAQCLVDEIEAEKVVRERREQRNATT